MITATKIAGFLLSQLRVGVDQPPHKMRPRPPIDKQIRQNRRRLRVKRLNRACDLSHSGVAGLRIDQLPQVSFEPLQKFGVLLTRSDNSLGLSSAQVNADKAGEQAGDGESGGLGPVRAVTKLRSQKSFLHLHR